MWNIVDSFKNMLRALSVDFGAAQIESVIACYDRENRTDVGFLLHMENGEYWFCAARTEDLNKWALFIYPPPVPALSALPRLALPHHWTMNPTGLNEWVKENGGGDNLFMELR